MNRLLHIAFAFLVFGLICGLSNAYSETIELAIGESATRTLDLQDGDVVSGRIALVGSTINFSVVNPDDIIMQENTVTGSTDFRFTAMTTGEYSFSFQNNISEAVTFVTFNYNVQHYIFGVPQEFILLFAIVVLALFAVVVFVALSPKP
ncbi:MAG: emp24/gp25L/p24 family protein [Candidatus Bathyarchaeota archaeon]|nr:emp24/gp25L/p24 family protein [Candidatus Bathyarchaeota archaeon]